MPSKTGKKLFTSHKLRRAKKRENCATKLGEKVCFSLSENWGNIRVIAFLFNENLVGLDPRKPHVQ
ncbi:hypothetical protein THF1C08_90150 [Vibrio jasicida]|uniref:Uncharacterized protein n=1 Tax=Vibrio jasicida TaxID=766224 RepID=A0AAU9QY49_9VIBR|nr:hypothetical protein THF1C08_90150 [Vibrio jasicida]CAH1603766.1 hypothetical protein THF1A12_80144 [Vibrio jasicida]